ncbi:hypothetical protein ACHAXR_004542 [Thalassiosira sp. AJA248-18]
MKKRRNNHPPQANNNNLEKFEDAVAFEAAVAANAGMNEDRNHNGGGGGGGMSRAAKKRAKKRAKTTSSTASTSPSSAAAAANGKDDERGKPKMQLPLDDDGEDGDTNNANNNNNEGGGGESLMGAVQKFRMMDTKKVKKKKKSKKDYSTSNNEGQAKAPPEETSTSTSAAKSATATAAAKEKEMMELDDTNTNSNMNDALLASSTTTDIDDDEMEPELEALLSTLTPLQILLLDSEKPSSSPSAAAAAAANVVASKMMNVPTNDQDEDDDEDDDEIAAKYEDNGGNEEDPTRTPFIQNNYDHDNNGAAAAALAGINPLNLIGDITTKHRARILLSSLISPSGLTLYEFYARYWGKRPLLACLQEVEDEEEDNNDGKKKEEPTTTSKEDEAIELHHATRLNGFLDRTLIDEMIQKNKLRYGLDLNVTRYTDSMGNGRRHRITLDPPPIKKKRKNKKKSGSGGSSDADNNNDNDEFEYIVANPKDVWANIDTSHCSLRLLRPHEHNDTIHTLLSLLESEFGCMVGSNAYLTPLNSQGFAPHYDDVDVFILQLEGYKRWRVYAPLNKRETLPRESSRDYTEKEMEGEIELMDVVLGPGDVLYLPRGWIHQAETVPRPSSMPNVPGITKDDHHSLHLTVSAMQNWSWADFLEILMPEALEGAASSDKSISLREGLPRNFLSYMGTMHQLDEDEVEEYGSSSGAGALPEGLKQVAEAQAKAKAAHGEEEEVDEEAMLEAQSKRKTLAHQKEFKDEAKKRIMRVCKQAMSMLDDACDQIGKRFLSDRLPPALLDPERCLTKEGLSDENTPTLLHHHHDASKKIWPNTLCRLARPDIARLVMEDDKAVLYHCLDNSRVFHESSLSPMEFEIDDAPALEQLLTTVEPHWIMVKDLIHGDVEDKMEVAQALFDEGILATMLVEMPDRSVQTG